MCSIYNKQLYNIVQHAALIDCIAADHDEIVMEISLRLRKR